MTKAEFLKLPMDQRGKILEEQAESVADIYNTPPGLCPDPIPDYIQEELTTLRERVKSLEEAMPDVFRLKVIAGACNELRQHTAEDSLLKMADRIESVMTKHPSEK